MMRAAALIGFGVAIALLVASFFQWWDVTYDGHLKLRRRVRVFFAICIGANLIAAGLVAWAP
jgi:uncharacterized membrane protein YidH (DUF202 family)